MIKNCLHCGRCTQVCDFLKKYTLDLAAFSTRTDLAYHCFLCGECSRACPVGIDGRKIAIDMRRAAPDTKGYGLLLWEKKNYKFKSYRHITKTALFPGCNFPSFYPKTTDVLVKIFRENNIEPVYDCCGKPVAELGVLSEDECAGELESRLKAHGIDELVVLCPNCYYFLKNRIAIKITDVYSKLREFGINTMIKCDAQSTSQDCKCEAKIFVPCPDRSTRELEQVIFTCASGILDKPHEIENIQCCGLGGCAAAKEPELSAGFRERVKLMQQISGTGLDIYTYCATCAGALARHGIVNVRHALVEILRTGESPELTWRSLLNRAKRKIT